MCSKERKILRESDFCYKIPKTTVGELAKELKSKLHMDVMQIVGKPETPVERVGILIGGGSLGQRVHTHAAYGGRKSGCHCLR